MPVLINQQDDICWLVVKRKEVEKTKRGLETMVKKQEDVNYVMRLENKQERIRSILVARELHRRYLKFNGIAKNNARLARLKLKYLKAKRKEVEKIISKKIKIK
jgi:hypothetical protein